MKKHSNRAHIPLILAACISATFAVQASATVDVDAKTDETFSASSSNSISQKKMVEEALEQGVIRDTLRIKSEMSTLSQNAFTQEKANFLAEKEARVQKFILDNVPTHILAAGEQSVKLYIEKNFVDINANAKVDTTPRVVWSSTDSSMSIPVVQDVWTPLPQVAQAVAVPVPPLPQATEDKVVATVEQSKDKPLSSEQSEAVKKLGMTEDELLAMLNPKDLSMEKAPKATKQKFADGVKIDSIKVTRIVMMGASNFADVTIEGAEVQDGQQRKINTDIQKLEKGGFFNIENSKFEVVALNEEEIVIENVSTKKTFKSSIR